MFLGDRVDGVDIGELPKEVDGEDRFSFGGDGGFDFGGIDAHRFGVDIDENGSGTELGDDFGGGDEGEGARDDFISGADIGGLHHDAEGIGSAVDADGVFDAMASFDDLFEILVVFAKDVGSGRENLGDGRIEGAPYFFVLGFEVNERHVHGIDSTRLA